MLYCNKGMEDHEFFIFCIENNINIDQETDNLLNRLTPVQKLEYDLDRYNKNQYFSKQYGRLHRKQNV